MENIFTPLKHLVSDLEVIVSYRNANRAKRFTTKDSEQNGCLLLTKTHFQMGLHYVKLLIWSVRV